MGVRTVRALVAGVALAFVLALVLGATGIAGAAKAYAAGTTLSVISGDVQVRSLGGTFATAIDGDLLRDGDTVRTGEGRAVLTYFEGSTVTIEPNTELTIDATTTASDGGTVVLMTQLAGRTWHVVTKLITGGARYEVRTPASTASVRGTEFEVDADADATTVTTTEGVVVQHVPDPSRPGATVDVRVSAGTTQTQRRNEPPAPAQPRPAAQRTVTMSIAATNTIVVDARGRANGVTRDGRVVVQTPGAQVRRGDGVIVVTMPDLPDGTVGARVEGGATTNDDVAVTTTIAERGRSVVLQQHAQQGIGAAVEAGVAIGHVDGMSDGTTLDTALPLPTPHVARPPLATAQPSARASATGGASPASTATPSAGSTARASSAANGASPSSSTVDEDRPAPSATAGAGLVVQVRLPALATPSARGSGAP